MSDQLSLILGRIIGKMTLRRGESSYNILNNEDQQSLKWLIGSTFIGSDAEMIPQDGDMVVLFGRVEKSEIVETFSYFITPGTDNESVDKFIDAHIWKDDRPEVIRFTSQLERDSQESLSNALDKEAVNEHYNLGSYLDPIDKFLKKWYQKRCVRRHRLLGATLKELEDSGIDISEFFSRALNNPYTLPTFPIEKADRLIKITGNAQAPEERYCGTIVRYLYSRLEKKETYFTYKDMINFFPDFAQYEDHLVEDYFLFAENDIYALLPIYAIEEHVVEVLLELGYLPSLEVNETAFTRVIMENNCDPYQIKALHHSLTQPISIITGMPGSGKTTLLRAFVSYLKYINKHCLVTSFTGKAVSRVRELVPEASPQTIHYLLKTHLVERNGPGFYAYIIVDEASMVETHLFYRFIKSCPPSFYEYRLVFIGDCNQLPPIGWGNLFEELIRSLRFPIHELKKCHRTEGVDILDNAKKILNGEFVKSGENFNLCFGGNVIELLKEHNLEPDSFRLISPYNKVVTEYNDKLRKHFFEGAPSLTDDLGREWFLGDQVMVIENNYHLGLMNGQEGKVMIIDEELQIIKIKFGAELYNCYLTQTLNPDWFEFYPPQAGYLCLESKTCISYLEAKKKLFRSGKRLICSDHENLYQSAMDYLSEDSEKDSHLTYKHIQPSLALTIHKAQGSEWDYVFVMVTGSAGSFLNRQLLYTGVTRAKKGVFCLGSRQGWMNGIIQTKYKTQQMIHRLLLMSDDDDST